jgi:flagellar protein FlaI
MVLGGTAAGKTTALNALACLIKPGSKIITIEETAELNLPHENWVSLIARRSYGLGENQTGEVTLFDLVKTSMRHRPDVLTVGEIRGNEAYVLFQAMATGHGGMSTMHAEDIDSAVKRLTQKPMNIAPAYIPLLNIALSVQRVHLKVEGETKAFRRVMEIDEIANYEDYRRIYKWQPAKDEYISSFNDSVMMPYISERTGLNRKDLDREIENRATILHWMREKNIRSYKDVAAIIAEYYARPGEFYEKVSIGDIEALATAKHS